MLAPKSAQDTSIMNDELLPNINTSTVRIKEEPNEEFNDDETSNQSYSEIHIKEEMQDQNDSDDDDPLLTIDEERSNCQNIKIEPPDSERFQGIYVKEEFELLSFPENDFVSHDDGNIEIIIKPEKLDRNLNNNTVTPNINFSQLSSAEMGKVFLKIDPKPFKRENERKVTNFKSKQRKSPKNVRRYACDLCGRRFGQKQSLVRHIHTPHVEPRAQLTEPLASSCDLTAELIRSELDNLTRYGKEIDRKCIICLKSFDRKGCAKRHLIEHIVANCRAASIYQCPLCESKPFKKVDDFKHHMRVHAALTSYKCGICDKSFGDSSNFSKHKKVHGSTHGQCNICRRKFRTAKMMELHMEHHEQTTPMECPKCDRLFYFESLLKKHLKTSHTKVKLSQKSYRCGPCEQRFASLKDKWHHQWTVHSVRKKRADCWLCDARFRIVSELRGHLSAEHGVSFTCKKIVQKQEK